MSTTISTSEVPPSLLNAQGTILDPVAIKKSSAAKMRLADKTGNVALRKEAAAEQSFADRLGGRTALLSDELKKQIQDQKEAAAKVQEEVNPESPVSPQPEEQSQQSPTTESKRSRKNKNKSLAVDVDAHKPLTATSEPFQPQKAQSTPTSVPALPFVGNLPPEAIILKLDAASKQSIADKTGNLVLKRTAALEQSLADKMAYVNAPGVTTTALRAGRKGFMIDTALLSTVLPPPTSPEAPKQKPQQSTSPKREQKPQQKKERSYFAKNDAKELTRADQDRDWRTPKSSPASTPVTSPTQHHSPLNRRHQMDGASVVVEERPKKVEDITLKIKQQHMKEAGPAINPLAAAGAAM